MSEAPAVVPRSQAALPPELRAPADAEMVERARSFLQQMKRYRPVRGFAATPVPRTVIETCIAAAGSVPGRADHQPWHFVGISDAAVKRRIREAADAEEKSFTDAAADAGALRGGAALGISGLKSFPEAAPWLIVVFVEGYRIEADRRIRKADFIEESAGIATGMLITALHCAGLATLIQAPQPLRLLNGICGRPENEKPCLIVLAGHPADGALAPRRAAATRPVASFL